MTTSRGKHLEDNSHAQLVSLMFELTCSSRGSVGLSTDFDRDRRRRQQELTNIKEIKGEFHVKIMLKDVFGLPNIKKKLLSASTIG